MFNDAKVHQPGTIRLVKSVLTGKEFLVHEVSARMEHWDDLYPHGTPEQFNRTLDLCVQCVVPSHKISRILVILTTPEYEVLPELSWEQMCADVREAAGGYRDVR